MNESITLLTWPDYVSPENIARFEDETGVAVLLEIVPSAVELVERMRSDGDPPDLLVPPDYAVRELSSDGLLLQLDHARLPNLEHLDPRFRSGRSHDPETRVSVIKDWGTTGFMVRTDRMEETPRSWADFWELARRFPGRTTVLDSPSEVIGAALKMRGRSYNDGDRDALDRARADLENLVPYLHSFETGYRPLLADGAVWLALGWNGDAGSLRAAGVPVEYTVPEEGSQIWEDDWAIAAGAPSPDKAHAWINFMLRPDNAAREALYTRYASGNRTALDLLPNNMKTDPAIYPPEDVLGKLEPGLPLDRESSARRAELWGAIRNIPAYNLT